MSWIDLPYKPAGGSGYIQVETFTDLPDPSLHLNEVYIVKTTTGIYGFRKLSGFYMSNGVSWQYLGDMSASYIAELYESNSNTNKFTNAYKYALDNPPIGVPTGGATGQVLSKKTGTNYDIEWSTPSGGGGSAETYETVSKNLKSWRSSLIYSSGILTSIVYISGFDTITKTLNYTSGILTSIVLSGDTPAGIDLTKTLIYTGSELTSVTYS